MSLSSKARSSHGELIGENSSRRIQTDEYESSRLENLHHSKNYEKDYERKMTAVTKKFEGARRYKEDPDRPFIMERSDEFLNKVAA